MTKEDFLKKLGDAGCSYMAPITKADEEFISKYTDFEVTPGSIKICKKEYAKTSSSMKFIK